jgi:molybdate-binding protein
VPRDGCPASLDFVPVTWEDFDIVLDADAAAAAEPLISALRETTVQSSLDHLGGYDLPRTGSVEFLS